MNSRAGGHPVTVAAWILVVALVIAVAFGVSTGILSRSLVVDLAALWPLFVVALIVGLAARLLRKSRRAGAILPLSLFTALVLAGAIHLEGWEQLPSASVRLVGPDPSVLSGPTELVAQISGDLTVSATDTAAYVVEPVARGGPVGVPQATETSVDSALSIRIEADPEAPSWYTFSGWEIGINPAVAWRLVLNGQIDADLTAITLSSAAIAGSGLIRLGSPPAEGASVIVAGDFEVIVPAGVPVTVAGDANVPDGWETDGERTRAPVDGTGWSISVQGDAIPTVREG
jgi:hypothetical protein